MAIATSLSEYLNQHQIEYHLLKHRRAASLLDTARASTLPPAAVAHSILLQDRRQRYWIALIGSDRHPDLKAISQEVGAEVSLCGAMPSSPNTWFEDCAPGVVPPFGAPYSIATLVDTELLEQPAVYLEDGDPTELIRIDRQALLHLATECRTAIISTQAPRH